MDVIIGTAPVNWNNQDVPDYRPWTPYQQMLDEMVAAGYTGTEFDNEFPAHPEHVRRDLAGRGLTPASTFCAINLRDRDQRAAEIARALERAQYVAALGGDTLIIADSGDERRRSLAGHVSAHDSLDDAAWQSLTSGLETLAEQALELGVRTVFHNHVGTYVETEDELQRLLDMTNADLVGLCYDVGHMLYGGGDVMRIVERYGDRIRYVHLKDVDMDVLAQARREKLSFGDALRRFIFTEFGQGGVDFERFFAALEALNYQGWIIVEQDTTSKTPLESARVNREYLRQEFGL